MEVQKLCFCLNFNVQNILGKGKLNKTIEINWLVASFKAHPLKWSWFTQSNVWRLCRSLVRDQQPLCSLLLHPLLPPLLHLWAAFLYTYFDWHPSRSIFDFVPRFLKLTLGQPYLMAQACFRYFLQFICSTLYLSSIIIPSLGSWHPPLPIPHLLGSAFPTSYHSLPQEEKSQIGDVKERKETWDKVNTINGPRALKWKKNRIKTVKICSCSKKKIEREIPKMQRYALSSQLSTENDGTNIKLRINIYLNVNCNSTWIAHLLEKTLV